MSATKIRSLNALVTKRADGKGRVTLGAEAAGKEFEVTVNEQGQVILTPMARVPEREAWLYRNPTALALFRAGLAESAAGQVSAPTDYRP